MFVRRPGAGAYLVDWSELRELGHGDVCNVLTLQLQGVAVAGVVAQHGPLQWLGLGGRRRGPDQVTRGEDVVVVPASLMENIWAEPLIAAPVVSSQSCQQ